MSRIEQLINQIEDYLDECKFQAFSNNKIIVDKNYIQDMLNELKLKTPDEVKKYQKIIDNKDAILNEAKEQADEILNAAMAETEKLMSEHEIMQKAYAAAEELISQAENSAKSIVDSAVEEANEIRLGAIDYTDDMLSKLQYILEQSINDNKKQYVSLINGLDDVLTIVNNNRKELNSVNNNQ